MAPNSIGTGPCGGGGMAALGLYTATSTTKFSTVDTLAALATAIITSISLIRIVQCPHAQPPTMPLIKYKVMPEGSTSICQALSPL